MATGEQTMRGKLDWFCGCLAVALFLLPEGHAAQPTREAAVAVLKPYAGATTSGAGSSTLTGKVMVGYQGWFGAPDDGLGLGWRHYGQHGQFKPGHCKFDLWPDMGELGADEKYATPFRHADGSTAYLFSSCNRKTVLRHFDWMRQYGIDGAFLQRFAGSTTHPSGLLHCNTVLSHCREGANLSGRCYAVMYDLSGLDEGGTQQVIDDWKLLVDRFKVGRDPKDLAYLKHGGKPVVAVWGIGFNDKRKYTLAECQRLIEFLKDDPRYGGNTVKVGVPTGWRTLDRDSVGDPALHAAIEKADIISPWTVGRYHDLALIDKHAEKCWAPDVAWCRERGKEYMPVVFPGFSWKNMYPDAKFDAIPRRKGEFLWRQYAAACRAGATMIYQAMFDEIDEGTAIFKCTNDPPVGESKFLTFEGLPTDHYLWLTGMGGRLLRGEIAAQPQAPLRTP